MLCPISVQSITQYVQGVSAFKCVRVGPRGRLNIKNYVIRAVDAKGDELERGRFPIEAGLEKGGGELSNHGSELPFVSGV
eukprot:7650260-Pyramimonas_sp.AAC.1